jgi:hypothetical protein
LRPPRRHQERHCRSGQHQTRPTYRDRGQTARRRAYAPMTTIGTAADCPAPLRHSTPQTIVAIPQVPGQR